MFKYSTPFQILHSISNTPLHFVLHSISNTPLRSPLPHTVTQCPSLQREYSDLADRYSGNILTALALHRYSGNLHLSPALFGLALCAVIRTGGNLLSRLFAVFFCVVPALHTDQSSLGGQQQQPNNGSTSGHSAI